VVAEKTPHQFANLGVIVDDQDVWVLLHVSQFTV
jgi:hypothetical protein